MQTIDNSGVIGYNKNLDYRTFLPVLNYAYNSGAATVTITDASTIPAASGAFKKVVVSITDKFGNVKNGSIAAAAGNTGALDVSGLNPSKGLVITATVVTTLGWTANGSAHNILAAGTLGGWNKGESAAESLNA